MQSTESVLISKPRIILERSGSEDDMNQEGKVKLVSAFAIICIVWGSTFLAIRYAIESIPPLLMAGFRFLSAGSVLYLWARRKAERPTATHWRSAVIVGIALFLFNNGGVTWAEQRVPSGVTALVVAAIPMWMVLLEWLFHGGGRPRPATIAGLVLGFAGVLLLIGPNPFSGRQNIDPVGIGVLLIASFTWANGSLYARKAKLPRSPLLAASMEMLAGGVALVIAGTLMQEWNDFNLAQVTMRSWLSLAYLSIFGSIIAFTAYIWLLNATTPSRVSTYAFVNPIIALLLGWGLADEQLTSQIFVAAALIVFAVALIITSRSHPKSMVASKESPAPAGSGTLAKCEMTNLALPQGNSRSS